MMHIEWMREALVEAKLAALAGEVPVGAVVVSGDRIIARAHNEREQLCDPTAHAEVLAIRRAAQALGRRRLHGCTLYVTLEPCPMCAGTIALSGLDAVYFGAYDPRMGCMGSVYSLTEDPAIAANIPAVGGLMEEECLQSVQRFFEAQREEINR